MSDNENNGSLGSFLVHFAIRLLEEHMHYLITQKDPPCRRPFKRVIDVREEQQQAEARKSANPSAINRAPE